MSTHRYICFWPQDWMNDGALRMCDVDARGLWIDLLCLAHSGEPYGHLTMNGGPMTPEHIAKVLRINPRTVRKLLRTLEEAGVFSRASNGAIYCRRMVRDSQKSEEGRLFANKRWSNRPNGSPSSPPTGTPNALLQNQISKSNSSSNAGAREEAPRQGENKNSVFKKERVDRSEDEPVSDLPEINQVIAFTAKALTMKLPYGEVRTKNQQLEAMEDRPRPKPSYLTREQLELARSQTSLGRRKA